MTSRCDGSGEPDARKVLDCVVSSSKKLGSISLRLNRPEAHVTVDKDSAGDPSSTNLTDPFPSLDNNDLPFRFVEHASETGFGLMKQIRLSASLHCSGAAYNQLSDPWTILAANCQPAVHSCMTP